jgi:hypothetical protein
MRLIDYIIFAALCFFATTQLRAATLTDDMSDSDYAAAAHYGHGSRLVLNREHAKAKARTDVTQVKKDIAAAFESEDRTKAAHATDYAINGIIRQAVAALKANGHAETAEQIMGEYEQNYVSAVARLVAGEKEIGDHPPLNEWLDSVHERIHGKLGNYWCQYFKLHDIEILNHGIPVVFNPKSYELADYKDHFAGHPDGPLSWVHHGVAGVVTYWAVQITCTGATFGMGMIGFVCGPLSGLAEHVMDKRIAPPIAERVWTRAQETGFIEFK